MTTRIDPEILDILKRTECDGDTLRLTEQLDRTLYVKTNKVIELLGGKWSRSRKAHVFSDTEAGARIAEVIMTGEVTDWKKLYQFFPTPPALARRVVQECGLMAGCRILEPSAGNGRLIEAAVNDATGFDCCNIVAVESNPDMVRQLEEMRDKWLYANEHNFQIVQGDFLTTRLTTGRMFDRVVMNPPFRNGQDVDHVRHAYDLLKPKHGRLVAIMSPSWTFRTDRKFVQFREWLETVEHTWEEIPEGEFAESGTNIRTILIRMRHE